VRLRKNKQKKVKFSARDRLTGLLYFTYSFLLYGSDDPNTTKCDSLRRGESHQKHFDITSQNNKHTNFNFLSKWYILYL